MEISSVLVFFFLIPLLIFLFYHQKPAKKPTPREFQSYPVLGILPQLLKNRHRFLEWTTEAVIKSPSHTIVFKSLGQDSGIQTANPLNIKHILKTNFKNYPKGKRTIKMLEDFLGHGIFNSDGEHWNLQRKAASFQFNKRSLRSFVVDTVQQEIIQRLLPLLKKASEKKETLDFQDVLERFAFDNICKVAFNEDPACLTEEGFGNTISSHFMKAFGEAQNIITARFLDALKITFESLE